MLNYGVGAEAKFHPRAVGLLDLPQRAANAAVARRVNDDLKLLARGKTGRFQTRSGQHIRAAQFHAPFDNLALGIGRRYRQPGVRIGPLKFFHGGFKRHRLGGVEHRKGMVRAHCAARNAQDQTEC